MEKGVVFKYPLNIGGVSIIEVPVHSQFISVKAQCDNPVAYFLQNTHVVDSEGTTKHRFYSVGTGHNFTIDRGMEFIETLLLHQDTFVLHVFKV